MQVKKFEARTMKEALEMVKTQLGPDAIILSARDNNRSFGLVGEGSVEITAAVSEETLHKKKFAESRLREQDKQKLAQSSAKVQKQVINEMVNKYISESQEKVQRPMTSVRYIEIDGPTAPEPKVQMQAAPTANVQSRAQASEIATLRGEIASLKQVISQFQSVPQNFQQGRHPGADYGLSYEVSAMFEKLTAAGVATEIAAEMLTLAQTEMPALKLKNKALVEAWAAKHILNSTKVVTTKPAQVQVFVGPAASGKTASLVKLASHYVVNEKKKIALVTTDSLKVGAVDQMRIYAHILNVPFAQVRQKSDWDNLLAQLSNYDHILVDCAGMSLKTMEEISHLRNMLPTGRWQPQTHLVLSCLAKDSDLTEMGRRYKATGFDDVIFTGLDESTQHGSIFNFMKRFSVPLHSFGTGNHVPEDFEVASKERILDLIFKITKQR